jgi:phospholipid-binding lipoprotein MlaA
VVLANDLLQGELKRGYATTMRMVINSTAGILGFIDIAKNLGFEEHNEDFGQTLAVWGVGEGFYLVLPIFGPSNPRDVLGKMLVDPYLDPLGYYFNNTDREEIGSGNITARGFTNYAAFVEQIDELRKSSLDFYGALRSLYRQRRNSEIKNGGFDDLPNIDSILDKRSVPPSLPKP